MRGAFWCRAAWLGDRMVTGVRIEHAGGDIVAVRTEAPPGTGDLVLGTVVPGMGDAHSHLFHRALRGRTHAEGGDFWQWRSLMYRVAARLHPELYGRLAEAVFAEMLVSGWTAVGEFHYVHHRPDGRPYPRHDMELAVADAAARVGIRVTLLDTCYLAGGVGQPLRGEQTRFSDGTAERWADRWQDLAAVLAGRAGVVLGAAVHSVRAVPPEGIAAVVAAIPPEVPLHVHVSEQPQENSDTIAAFGRTPTAVLASAGALAERTTVVHATHLLRSDIELLGAARVSVAVCPTTEADLGDGIGPAKRLREAGARIVLGSDQNAVIDPFLEARGLEAGQRLGSGKRARFGPEELYAALGPDGYRSLGLTGGIAAGSPCDLVEVDTGSVRTAGSEAAQLPLVATAADVRRVIVAGRVVADTGRLLAGTEADPATLLRGALTELEAAHGG